MGNRKKLLNYIDYFKEKESKFYELKTPIDGSSIVRYYDYNIKVLNFLDDFSKTDMVDYSYSVNMEKIDLDKINELNERQVGTVLTYCLRMERFTDGIWAKAIDKGIFLKCLERLNLIVNK